MSEVLLIWDIDGTLMSSKGIGRRAMDNAFKQLYNIENGFEKVEMSGRLDFQIVMDAHKHHGIRDYDMSDFYKTYENELKKEITIDTEASVLTGIKDILETKRNNIYHILGTGNCEVGARLKLSHVGINHYFVLGGFGDEDVDRWKMIEKAYNKARDYYKLQFDKEKTYVIGDTPYDVECAKKLGFKSIAVSTGSHSFTELESCDADYLLSKLDIDIIDKIISEK